MASPETSSIETLAEEGIQTQMVRRWLEMAVQCRETLDFWRASNFRVVVNGIDITEAEHAYTEARIMHLSRLIVAVHCGEAGR